MTTMCNCAWCKFSRWVRRNALSGSKPQMRKTIVVIMNRLVDAEAETDYYRCVMKGVFPGSIDILKQALHRAMLVEDNNPKLAMVEGVTYTTELPPPNLNQPGPPEPPRPPRDRAVSETYDDKHHKYEGPDFGSCIHCGLAEECDVHQSYEAWSKETDEIFGARWRAGYSSLALRCQQ